MPVAASGGSVCGRATASLPAAICGVVEKTQLKNDICQMYFVTLPAEFPHKLLRIPHAGLILTIKVGDTGSGCADGKGGCFFSNKLSVFVKVQIISDLRYSPIWPRCRWTRKTRPFL